MSSDDLSRDDEEIFGPDPLIGSALQGRFRIESVLGYGRSGRVYRATQFPMNRPVAVKLLRTDIMPLNEALIRRFGVLVAKSARLSHPHTVTLIDYGASEKRELFIVMELVNGPPLASMLDREGPLDWTRATRCALQIARSLRDAHYKGVMHRGLSPTNLFLVEDDDDREFVKVSDFGVFGIFPFGVDRPPPPIHRPRKTWDASLAYTAPEQLGDGPVDARIDVYALGCVLFEMLADRPPYTGRTPTDVARQHLEAEPPTLEDLGLFVPPQLESTVRACLEKSPANRIGSMSDLMIRLKELSGETLTGDLTVTSTIPIPDVVPSAPSQTDDTAEASFQTPSDAHPAPPTTRRSRAVFIGVLVAAAIAVGAAAAWLVAKPGAGPTTDTAAPSAPADAVTKVPVSVTSEPPGAQVYVDGELVGATPTRWEQRRSSEEALVIVRSPGYVEAVERIVFDGPRDLAFTLEAAPEAPTEEADEGIEAEDYKQNPY